MGELKIPEVAKLPPELRTVVTALKRYVDSEVAATQAELDDHEARLVGGGL